MQDSERGFDFLRISLEAKLTGPAIITVTSAREDDGASIVAGGLAEAFAAADHATMLVSANTAAAPMKTNSKLSRASAKDLTADRPGGSVSLPRAVAELRSKFAVVIVDAAPISTSATAFELAREADGVVVAIRLGRKPCAEDRTTMKLLGDSNSNVFGIVPTNGRAHAASKSLPAPVSVGISRPLEVTR